MLNPEFSDVIVLPQAEEVQIEIDIDNPSL